MYFWTFCLYWDEHPIIYRKAASFGARKRQLRHLVLEKSNTWFCLYEEFVRKRGQLRKLTRSSADRRKEVMLRIFPQTGLNSACCLWGQFIIRLMISVIPTFLISSGDTNCNPSENYEPGEYETSADSRSRDLVVGPLKRKKGLHNKQWERNIRKQRKVVQEHERNNTPCPNYK